MRVANTALSHDAQADTGCSGLRFRKKRDEKLNCITGCGSVSINVAYRVARVIVPPLTRLALLAPLWRPRG